MAAAMLVAFAAITYRNVKQKTGPLAPLPLPSQYVAPTILFGLLGLATGAAETPAFALAVAVDVGIVFNLWGVGPNGSLIVKGQQRGAPGSPLPAPPTNLGTGAPNPAPPAGPTK